MNPRVNKPSSLPPLSHFDQSFSDNTFDVLFCALNDIEPALAETTFTCKSSLLSKQVLDPRTNQPVTQSTYDHTIYQRPQIFRCPNRSALKMNEHKLCLSFLQSLKAKTSAFPHQVSCFENTLQKRQKEQADFLQFLKQYNSVNFEKIYAPNLLLVELYQKLYKQETELLMKKHQDGIFQIHTGFPIPQKCGNAETLGSICVVEVLGENPTLPVLDSQLDLSKIKPKIENLFNSYLEGLSGESSKDLKAGTQFNISLEALVFLLCAGEYIDIPLDVIVQVVASDDGDNIIHISDPLPSRNTGPHTAERVADICAEVLIKSKANECTSEISPKDFEGSYQLKTFDEFMGEHLSLPKQQIDNSIYVKWNLNLDNSHISISSRTKHGYKDNPKSLKQTFYSLKLEYKPQFGCEIISKVNLLREWLQLQLSSAPDACILRHRINANNFQTVLTENLQLTEIEQELEKRYKVKTNRLLGSLGDFLGMLSNIRPGRYMLRYNPRFTDKLMLYAEANESVSKSSVTLYSLLQEIPNDLAFMTLRQLTPIDDCLCTAMHDFYKVLPCSFPSSQRIESGKRKRRVFDDRIYIHKKVKAKMDMLEEKKKIKKQKRNHIKRIKKAGREKAKKKEALDKQKDATELEDEIKNDCILFGLQ